MCVHIYIFLSVCVCTHAFIYICICTCVCAHTHTHTYIHTHTHTHTHNIWQNLLHLHISVCTGKPRYWRRRIHVIWGGGHMCHMRRRIHVISVCTGKPRYWRRRIHVIWGGGHMCHMRRRMFRLFIAHANGTFFGMSESLETSTRRWSSSHVPYDSTNKPKNSYTI